MSEAGSWKTHVSVDVTFDDGGVFRMPSRGAQSFPEHTSQPIMTRVTPSLPLRLLALTEPVCRFMGALTLTVSGRLYIVDDTGGDAGSIAEVGA